MIEWRPFLHSFGALCEDEPECLASHAASGCKQLRTVLQGVWRKSLTLRFILERSPRQDITHKQPESITCGTLKGQGFR